ncbi:hypothetical protein Poli38472_008152 [Pythium oligandrum]|uniref:Protein SERAC1 n=1 Tax=Pythium oligandrum TaxID=41045 RepID=A0A8K1CMV8_PYTOL|nr:hypothetical protein Poli38472_008152 [Pythium oligandrum]|eukprot:TMW65510.1 hypothetical protein Poli38472_008152 [Pythium oligandrum]
MLRVRLRRLVTPSWRRRWVSDVAGRDTKPKKRPRSTIKTAVVLTGSLGVVLALASRDTDATQRPSFTHLNGLFLRSGWLLSSTFAAHIGLKDELLGGSDEREDTTRVARRMLWWESIQAVRNDEEEHKERRVQDTMVAMLVHLMLQSDDASGVDEASASVLQRLLIERGVLELLVDYVALEKPTDDLLLQKIVRCLQIGLVVLADEHHRTSTFENMPVSIPLVPLGVAMSHLLERGAVRFTDLVQLGNQLMAAIRREETGPEQTYLRFRSPKQLDDSFATAATGFLRLLSPEMPLQLKQFAMRALTSMLRAADQLPESYNTHQLDGVLSVNCATFLLALPRSNLQLQAETAALMNALTQIAPKVALPVPQQVYELWMKQVRYWTTLTQYPALQLASAMCLRTLSTHPRPRQFLSESPETMDALFQLSQQLHEAQHGLALTPSRRRRRKQAASQSSAQVYDRLTRVLIQKHLARAFANICTNFKSGEIALDEAFASSPVSLQSKRTLPMSKVFRDTHDLNDLPVVGADEYDADVEFGWIDILTQWTGSSDRDVRKSAIDSLVHLVSQDATTETGKQKQQHILQAWLMSMLQHVRNISGGGELLAVKQVENIAMVSDEMTPGNEKVLFNPAVVDAGASALAILAEQHRDELLDYGIVPLTSLLATKCTSTLFDFESQCARVIANLVASCCQAVLDQQNNTAGGNTIAAATLKPRLNAYGAPFVWKSFLADHYDVEHMLRSYPTGVRFLEELKSWGKHDDPMVRSQLYRALVNMKAYREVSRLGYVTLPVYEEGVHPVVHQWDGSGELSEEENDHSMKESVDIVFVHGLRGHPFGTWRTDMNDAIDAKTDIWPDFMLSKDLEELNLKPRVITLGYEAGMVSWSSPWPSLTLQERAKVMLRALYAANVGREKDPNVPSRPVIFVTHSMGGLLVKKMLLTSENEKREAMEHNQAATNDSTLASATKGVVFLAVPHFGSDLTRGIRSESIRSLLRTHPAIQDLCASNDRRLETLNEDFCRLDIDCLSVGEEIAAPLALGISAVVVKPDSANPGIGEFFVLPQSDHMTICKAKSRDEPLYQRILDYIAHHVSSSDSSFQ